MKEVFFFVMFAFLRNLCHTLTIYKLNFQLVNNNEVSNETVFIMGLFLNQPKRKKKGSNNLKIEKFGHGKFEEIVYKLSFYLFV